MLGKIIRSSFEMLKYRKKFKLNYTDVTQLVPRAVASDTRGPLFESRNRQTFMENICLLSTVVKRKNKEKEAGNGPFFFKKIH